MNDKKRPLPRLWRALKSIWQITGRIRWAYALWMDGSGEYCWGSLALWAMRFEDFPSKDAAKCKQEAKDRGTCYCCRYMRIREAQQP